MFQSCKETAEYVSICSAGYYKDISLAMDMACCCKDYDFSCLGSKLEQDWDLVEYYQRSCVFNACCWSNYNDMSTDIVYVKSTVSCKR